MEIFEGDAEKLEASLKRNKAEKTQKRNPHQLPIKQHVFPSHSIQRFLRPNGTVEIFLKREGKRFLAKPDNPIFCSDRAWDNRAETGYMKEIEDKFQDLAESIIADKTLVISPNERESLNDFLILWYLRGHYKDHPMGPQKLRGIPAQNFSKDDQEKMEKIGVGFIRSDSTISGHEFTGMRIQLDLFSMRHQLKTFQWVIARTKSGEFAAPDSFKNLIGVIPLNSNCCLITHKHSAVEEIGAEDVAQINGLVIKQSRHCYFAKDLSRCPSADNDILSRGKK